MDLSVPSVYTADINGAHVATAVHRQTQAQLILRPSLLERSWVFLSLLECPCPSAVFPAQGHVTLT